MDLFDSENHNNIVKKINSDEDNFDPYYTNNDEIISLSDPTEESNYEDFPETSSTTATINLSNEISEKTPLNQQNNSVLTNRKQKRELTQNETLAGHLNYYIDGAKSELFPEFYQLFEKTLKPRTGLIDYAKQENAESAYNWGKGCVLFKEIDKIMDQEGLIPRASPPQTWGEWLHSRGEWFHNTAKGMGFLDPMDWKWHVVRGVGLAGLVGMAGYGYGCSSWGIDPTRLFLMGSAFPFLPIQEGLSLVLSFGTACYHTPFHLMEGWNQSTSLYNYLFKNWGVSETHGFMTVKDDEYKSVRDLNFTEEDRKVLRDHSFLKEQDQAKRNQDLNKKYKNEPKESNKKKKEKKDDSSEEFLIEDARVGLPQMNELDAFENDKNGFKELTECHVKERETYFNLKDEELSRKVRFVKENGAALSQRIEEAKAHVIKKPHVNDIAWKSERCSRLLGDAFTDLLGKTVLYSSIAFVGIMESLGYGLTFLIGEIENFQSIYGYAFVVPTFCFIFGTVYYNLYTQYSHWCHEKTNQANPEVNELKTALIRGLEKNGELVDKNADYAEKIYEVLESGSELSKFSALCMKIEISNAPTDSESVRKMIIAATDPSQSLVGEWGRSIFGSISAGLLIVPNFWIFGDITKIAITTGAGFTKNAAYYASFPIAGLVTVFKTMEMWVEEPGIFPKLVHYLSWNRPLWGLKWMLTIPSLASAAWTTMVPIGLLSDVLGDYDPSVKYIVYATSSLRVPKALLWALERWDDWIRLISLNLFAPRGSELLKAIGIPKLIEWENKYITLRSKRLRMYYLREWAKKAIHAWDEETTKGFAYPVLDIKMSGNS